MKRYVQAVIDARLLGRRPFDGAEQPVGGGRVAAGRPGTAGHVGSNDDVELRVAVDDHPVVPDTLVRLRPVRRTGWVNAGDVIDDDSLASRRQSDDLEPEGALGAASLAGLDNSRASVPALSGEEVMTPTN